MNTEEAKHVAISMLLDLANWMMFFVMGTVGYIMLFLYQQAQAVMPEDRFYSVSFLLVFWVATGTCICFIAYNAAHCLGSYRYDKQELW